MKLVLASSGFDAPEAVEKCAEMVGKPKDEISFAVIAEAMKVEGGDHRWFLDDMDSIRNNFGGAIEFVDLGALEPDVVKERVMAADVIFVEGGNTDYLATVYEKSGFGEILPELLEKKVYVGSSAGSCVLGHRPSYKTFAEIYEEAQYTDRYPELVNLTVLPHLHSEHFNTRGDEWAIEDSKEENAVVYAISDSAAVVVDGDETYVVGKDYLVIDKGEVIERG